MDENLKQLLINLIERYENNHTFSILDNDFYRILYKTIILKDDEYEFIKNLIIERDD